MNRSSLVVGGLGLLALLAAVGVAVLEPSVPSLALLGTDWAVFAVAGFAIAVGLVGLLRTGTPTSNRVDAVTLPDRPSTPTLEHRRATETIDRALERPELGETTADAGRRSYQRRQAQAAINRTVVSLLADRHDVSPAEAGQQLREGSWTDDPRAAAYAGDASLPLRLRLEDWAHGAGHQRGLRAAIEEVDALAESPPESSRELEMVSRR